MKIPPVEAELLYVERGMVIGKLRVVFSNLAKAPKNSEPNRGTGVISFLLILDPENSLPPPPSGPPYRTAINTQ
jgi:hypothetical protein